MANSSSFITNIVYGSALAWMHFHMHVSKFRGQGVQGGSYVWKGTQA